MKELPLQTTLGAEQAPATAPGATPEGIRRGCRRALRKASRTGAQASDTRPEAPARAAPRHRLSHRGSVDPRPRPSWLRPRHPLGGGVGTCSGLRWSDMDARPLPFRPDLVAPGAGDVAFHPTLPIDALPQGSMRRVSFGDLDVLLAHTPDGIAAVDDRCPHMAAPLSVGSLDGCVVSCPLHDGKFDLGSGESGPDAHDGRPRSRRRLSPVWTPAGKWTKDDVPGRKATARATRGSAGSAYYPVRIVDGTIEVAVPVPAEVTASLDQAPPRLLRRPGTRHRLMPSGQARSRSRSDVSASGDSSM